MHRPRTLTSLAIVASLWLVLPANSEAGGFRRRVTTPIPTAVITRGDDTETGMLGSFYPNPTIMVGGASPTGGGYSPLGQYGTSTLATYGPIAATRSTSAPVRVYSRGYDGRVYERQVDSFSNPYFPEASPVIFPTPNASYYRPRRGPSAPAGWPSPINWVDQN